MSHLNAREDIFRYGENDRGMAIVTLPTDAAIAGGAPVVVILNSGLLHRPEPYRLHATVARELADLGYICLRVDLSGKGDTPSRDGLTNRESVALDWSFIKSGLVKRFGVRPIVIFGLCSGADNGIKLTGGDPDVKGLVLLDPESPKDDGFKLRGWINQITNPYKWLKAPYSILMRFLDLFKKTTHETNELSARDLPWPEDVNACFNALVARQGRVLAIFTSHALYCYNQQGQMARALAVKGAESIFEEEFWPHTRHVYSIQRHRDQLVDRVKLWGKQHLEHFKAR